jgi:hypothetical protein
MAPPVMVSSVCWMLLAIRLKTVLTAILMHGLCRSVKRWVCPLPPFLSLMRCPLTWQPCQWLHTKAKTHVSLLFYPVPVPVPAGV